ncbi:serine/threonine protein kinase [Marinicella rhabdoformis]|uniref:serine/threonine protein kinase n=1 Tax=Marinicella rhabdoformis TaxID=2580566 RepID=UPI0012AED226|nr:serine/threonine-protein kinase [Marinicella rhabdoformis]
MSDTGFQQVNDWFQKLVDFSADEQQQQLEAIKQKNLLLPDQITLLMGMLQADAGDESLPENIKEVTAEWHEQDASLQMNETPHLGNYRLIKPIGTGGMGHVYLAERADGSYKKQVAIKISQFQVKESMVKRFENERQILAKLNHSHIAQLLDGGAAADGRPYLVMEYVKGKDIAQYCIDRKLGLRARLRLILQVCEAVSYAHQQLVLHRDLKPNNILVNDQNQVKLLDFGIAKLLDAEGEQLTQTATQVMTRSYASPEQIKGEQVTTSTDVFSLAVVAYELLTGYHPYPYQSGLERDQNVVSGQFRKFKKQTGKTKAMYPELTTIANERLKGDIENILHKALSPLPENRYPSIEAFAEDIRHFLYNRPIMARRPSAWYLFKKMVQRHKAVFTVSTVASLLLIYATIYSLNLAREAEFQKQVAQEEAAESQQVTELLTNIFLKANPNNRQTELTAQDLLLQGFKEVKNGLVGMPEQRFALMNSILSSMYSLGYFDSVVSNFDHAYPECVDILGAADEACQSILLVTSMTATRLQKNEEAVRLLEIAENNTTVNDEELRLRISTSKFSSLMNLKRAEEAKDAALSALALMNKLNKTEVEKVDIYSDLAVFSTHQGDFEAAQKYFDLCLEFLDNEGKDNADFRSIYHANYGFFFYKQLRFDESLVQRQAAVDVVKGRSNLPSLDLAWALEALAMTQFYAADLGAAIETAEQTLATHNQLDSETHQAQYDLMLYLAEFNFLAGRIAQAEDWFKQVVEKHESDTRCRYELAQTMLSMNTKQARMKVNEFAACIEHTDFKPFPEIYWHLLSYIARVDAGKHKQWLEQYWTENPKMALALKSYFVKIKNN